jgi:hypothetical protein
MCNTVRVRRSCVKRWEGGDADKPILVRFRGMKVRSLQI